MFKKTAAGWSEVLVSIYQTTQWHILKEHMPHSHRCENVKVSQVEFIRSLHSALKYQWRNVGNCKIVNDVCSYLT
jgi:hypothetical protein